MCVFCKIVEGSQEFHKIYEDDLTLAFLNIKPTYEGLTLVIPKAHYENMFDCPKDLYHIVVETVLKVSSHYRSLGYDITILSNNGVDATGQSVPHLHFQIVPRKRSAPIIFLNKPPRLERDFNAEQKKFRLN